AYAPMV
ncbi:hypothetical protein D041_2025B, partial [Vibrio parahaemolyticus EKP-008]